MPRSASTGDNLIRSDHVPHRSVARAAAPERRVRLSRAAAEPVPEREWRGGGVSGCRNDVAAGGGGGGVHEAAVVGGSADVGDVLLGDGEGELGMHGWP